jgi:S1-C subfamily serine protease
MERVVSLAEDVIQDLTTVAQRPQFVKLPRPGGNRPIDFPKLGIRPDYTDDREGVLVGGVTEGGPAARAGIKDGDRIVELGGKTVPNLQTYMQVLSEHKKGEEIEVVVTREGKRVTLKVKPE